jgi:hypothetical protein
MGGAAVEWYETQKICPELLHVFGVSQVFGVDLLGYRLTVERSKCK